MRVGDGGLCSLGVDYLILGGYWCCCFRVCFYGLFEFAFCCILLNYVVWVIACILIVVWLN